MAFRIRTSHLVAAAITAGIAGWMATGHIEVGGRQDNSNAAPPIAEREQQRSSELFKVRYVPLLPEQREENLRVRGRTEADAIIPIRVETGGILQERLVDKGEKVEAGDMVCKLDPGARSARVAQAKAALAQAEADYESSRELSEKGFSSKSTLRQLNAAFEAAKATLEEAETELERTRVRANASGTVQDPIAEPGDVLKSGEVCITLINTDPMLFTGQISERDIEKVEEGMEARVELVTGDRHPGKVIYIASSADAQTRTFQVEIAMDNPDGKIRSGLTASAYVELEPTTAFRVSPAWISLADNGEIGVKTLTDEDEIRFVPVTITAQTQEGFWITGPEPGARVVTTGHEYVVVGEAVEAIADPMVRAGLEEGMKPATGERTQ